MKAKDLKTECKQHERRWKDYCVDKNLEDEWLERFNRLKAFRLVGICEGHMQKRLASTSKYPYVNFTLRDEIIASVTQKWPDLKTVLLQEAEGIFNCEGTKTRLELNQRLRVRKRKIMSHDEMKLRMVSNTSRDQDNMGEGMRAWFQGCLTQIEELDCIIYSWHKRIAP